MSSGIAIMYLDKPLETNGIVKLWSCATINKAEFSRPKPKANKISEIDRSSIFSTVVCAKFKEYFL